MLINPLKVRFNTKRILSPIIFLIIGLLIGSFLMYLFNLNWVLTNKYRVEAMVNNYEEVYEIQDKLISNYKNSFDELYKCIMATGNECDPYTTMDKFQNIYRERQELNTQLNQLNGKTEMIIDEFPQTYYSQ